MSDWLKVERSTPAKPEVVAIADMMGMNADEVFGKLFRVWCWFDENTLDGNAPSVTDSALMKWLDALVGAEGFAGAMQKVGWLDGTKMPNFDKHNGKGAKNRALTYGRVKKYRDGNEEKSNAVSVTNSLPDKIRLEVKAIQGVEVSPPPPPPKNREAVETAKRTIAYLNTKAGTKFEPSKENVSLIVARILGGADEAKLLAVVDAKCAEWLTNAEMRQYLRPSTLFNATKFSQYAGQVGATAPVAGTGALPSLRSLVAVLRRDTEDALPNQVVTYFADIKGFDFEREARRSMKAHAKFLRGSLTVLIEFEGERREFPTASLGE